MKTASDHFDLDSIPPQMLDEKHYCEVHDTFKMKDAMGDFRCPACRVLAGFEAALDRKC